MKIYVIDENDFETAGQVIDSAYSSYDTPVITKETIMSKAIDVDTSNLINYEKLPEYNTKLPFEQQLINDCKPFYQSEVSDFIKQELAKQNKPLEMIYVGFSRPDCESWYECPKCKARYGSWSFINGTVTVTDGKFKCHKCETILYVPK